MVQQATATAAPSFFERLQQGFLQSFQQQVAPAEFVCPLTKKIMEQPYMTRTGATFERAAILERMECPVTNQALGPADLLPNYALRAKIQAWKQENGGKTEAKKQTNDDIVFYAASKNRAARRSSKEQQQLKTASPPSSPAKPLRSSLRKSSRGKHLCAEEQSLPKQEHKRTVSFDRTSSSTILIPSIQDYPESMRSNLWMSRAELEFAMERAALIQRRSQEVQQQGGKKIASTTTMPRGRILRSPENDAALLVGAVAA